MAAASGSPSTISYHQPVLTAEVVNGLTPAPGKLFVDGTIGGAGHTKALLATGASVIGIDRDQDALTHVERELSGEIGSGRLVLRKSDFRGLPAVLNALGVEVVDGLLLDLGVSSWQLDTAGRGFSFQADGPLDMRMDQLSGSTGAGSQTAAQLLNTATETDLKHIFQTLGEEPAAGTAARAIIRAREAKPLQTTFDLTAVLERALPKRGPKHPATRVFQALRMAVNDELGALEEILDWSPRILRPGGRLAVIAFHSLEDRIVKNYLRETSSQTLDRPEWPAPRANPHCFYRLLTRKPLVASNPELTSNPRSRSAKLRTAERLGTSDSRDRGGNSPSPQ